MQGSLASPPSALGLVTRSLIPVTSSEPLRPGSRDASPLRVARALQQWWSWAWSPSVAGTCGGAAGPQHPGAWQLSAI